MSNTSIKRKLTILLLTGTVAVFLSCAAFLIFELYADLGEMVSDLTGIAEITGNNCKAALSFNVPEDAEQILSALTARPSIVFASIYDAHNHLFSEHGETSQKSLAAPPPTTGKDHLFKDGYLHVFYRIEQDGEHLGTTYIRSDLQRIVTAVTLKTGAITLLMLLISLVA